MKTDDDLAIIEIIDDDTDPFGDRGTNTTIHDTGGPRWVGPVAGAALLALMAYGVATSASSNSAPKVAPVTTIAHAPTTTQPPAPTTTVPAPLVPYYSADPPREYNLQNVQFEDTQGGRSSAEAGQLPAVGHQRVDGVVLDRDVYRRSAGRRNRRVSSFRRHAFDCHLSSDLRSVGCRVHPRRLGQREDHRVRVE